jgi:hypothetical protein
MAKAIKDTGKIISYESKGHEGSRSSRGKLHRANEYFEHFNTTTTIPAGLVLATGGTAVAATTYGVGIGGTSVLTTDDVAAAYQQLTHAGLLWECDNQPDNQPLVFETRLKAGATITTVEIWAGFVDTLTPGDAYALSATSTFTTSGPADAAVLGFSTTPTSGAAFTTGGNEIVALSSLNTVDSVVGKSGTVFAASTYYTLRVELDSLGNAAFFVDGKFVLGKGSAVTKTVPLTGFVSVVPRATAGGSERVITVDYIYIGGR